MEQSLHNIYRFLIHNTNNAVLIFRIVIKTPLHYSDT